MIITTLVDPPSSDVDAILAKIDTFENCAATRTNCLTNITLAIDHGYSAMNAYKRPEARHTVVMVTDGEHTDGIVKESICRTDVIKKDNTDITLITLAAGQASGAFSEVDGNPVPPLSNCEVKCFRTLSFQPVECTLDEADDFTCPSEPPNGYGLVFPDVQAVDCGMFYLDYYASSPYPIANVPGGADLTVALDQLDNLIAATCLDVLFVCWTMTSCDSPVSLVIHARGSPIINALASDIKCDINDNVVNDSSCATSFHRG